MITVITMILFSTMSILWTIPFFMFQLFGLRLFVISDKQQAVLAIKKLNGFSSMHAGDKPRGVVIGKYYVGYINEVFTYTNNGPTTNCEIYILSTKNFHETLTKHEFENQTKQITISIYERTGNFFHLSYNTRMLDVTRLKPYPNQKKHIQTIISNYQKKKVTVALIHGKPGSGKSMIPVLLAKQLKASLCDTYKPTDPGDNIALIYNSVCPTYENPLILVLEEFDIMIYKIHNNLVESHKSMATQIKDKTECNQFFDKINRGFFPNLIIIQARQFYS